MLRSISFRSTASSSPPDKEMHEIIQPNSADDAMDTIRPPELTVVDDRNTQRSECPFIYTLCAPTTHRPCRTMHRTLSHLKEKLIPHRAKRLINAERNQDYVVIDKPGSEHISAPQDLIHRHESYETERMQVQYSVSEPMYGVSDAFDMLATRSGVECDGQYGELMESQQDFIGSASSTSASSSSTSTTTSSSTASSNHEFAGIDRTILDDTEYIRAQSVDLERVTMFEIAQSKNLQSKRRLYCFDEAEEAAFLKSYSEAMTKNAQLQEELRRLTEDYERIHSPWTCTSCTYLNEPYAVTHLNVCQMCESPSPSKQMMLMQ